MYSSNYCLLNNNTFRVDSVANEYFSFDSNKELIDFCIGKDFKNINYFILGGGSNVLFKNEFNGLVIHPLGNECRVIKEDGEISYVSAQAGLNWDEFVAFTIRNKLSGLENLSLIPGNVGASPVQNIGAYGSEACEYIDSVECFNLITQEFITFTNKECLFSYRTSLFKCRKELVILSVIYKLKRSGKCSFKELSQAGKLLKLCVSSISFKFLPKVRLKVNFEHLREILALSIISARIKRQLVLIIRKKTMPDPAVIASVGCFFKSPILTKVDADALLSKQPDITCYKYNEHSVKVSAGDLIKNCISNIDEVINVGVDSKRPIILINHGGASGDDIIKYANLISSEVESKFKVKIEPEVVIV